MTEKFKKTINETKQEYDTTRFKFSANRIVAETPKSVFVIIKDNENIGVWLPKSTIYKAEYGNYVSTYLNNKWEFPIFKDGIEKKYILTTKELHEAIALENQWK